MIRETFHNQYKGWGETPSEDAVVEVVMRTHKHTLSPSAELLSDYKNKRINWAQFVTRFKKEMDNDTCKKEMMRIKKLSKEKDVYLVCACYNKEKRCHRFILMDMINNIE